MIVSLEDRSRDELRKEIDDAPAGSSMILVVAQNQGKQIRFRCAKSGALNVFETMGMLWSAIRAYDDSAKA